MNDKSDETDTVGLAKSLEAGTNCLKSKLLKAHDLADGSNFVKAQSLTCTAVIKAARILTAVVSRFLYEHSLVYNKGEEPTCKDFYTTAARNHLKEAYGAAVQAAGLLECFDDSKRDRFDEIAVDELAGAITVFSECLNEMAKAVIALQPEPRDEE